MGPSGRQAITKRSLCCRPQMLLEGILSFRVGGRQGCGYSLPNCHKNAKSCPEVSYLGACDYPRQFGSGPKPFQLSTIFGILTSCIGEHGCSIFFLGMSINNALASTSVDHPLRENQPREPGMLPFYLSCPRHLCCPFSTSLLIESQCIATAPLAPHVHSTTVQARSC